MNDNPQPTLAEISDWLEAEFAGHGVAVALITAKDTTFYLHGFADHDGQQAVGKQTLFEIGSVTKPLVGLLTALAIVNKHITLDSIVASILTEPAYQQHQYSIAQLLSHESGLPRLPENLPLHDLADPYARYSHTDLMTAMATVTPGAPEFEYSNFGYGLLAELISQQQEISFAILIQQQLFSPLEMKNSTIAQPQYNDGNHYKQRAQGHLLEGTVTDNWHFKALAGAGAVLATIDDMAILVQRYLHATGGASSTTTSKDDSVMAKAMRLSITPPTANTGIGFGWMLHPQGLVWHNGQTGGFNAFVGFAPAEHVGIVILANVTNPVTPGGLALLQQMRQQLSTARNGHTKP